MKDIIRVISGKSGGLKLKTLKSDATRPTSDKVKGGLFNMLAPYIEDARVLDLFAGTGSLGIEALSRGSRSAVFVDKSPDSIAIIRENLRHTGLSDGSTVINSDVYKAINNMSKAANNMSHNADKFDIIFLDPPYNAGLVEDVLNEIVAGGIIKTNGLVVVETDISNLPPEESKGLRVIKNRRYGRTLITIYEAV
ncbi:MAG: 16S rRNA (guanine(966)-N(2))-methyltransferase RsmD [Eubacteriales bacterium]|nr:16S rRNA (guanine(966)-N(2))-methyltransferase RsmD [Eubacteriales bacterium]